jgi:hypothetical protein
MFDPFFRHWYVRGELLAADTVKVAGCPAGTVWLTGCIVILGEPLVDEFVGPAHPARNTMMKAGMRRRTASVRTSALARFETRRLLVEPDIS